MMSYATRQDILPYVSHAIDDALNVHAIGAIPDHATLVVYDRGIDADTPDVPMVVAVWSYLPGCTVDASEAVDLAGDYLSEKGWPFLDAAQAVDFLPGRASDSPRP
jgi:hypothetical protein